MANDYYEHDNPFVAGTLVASAAVNSQLDLIETGFEAAEATLAKTVQVPSDFTGITQIPSQTFPNKLIYINTAGNVDLYSLAAFDASVTASADSATASADSAAAAASSAGDAATQAGLATDQVGLATTQVGLAATQVGLAAGQVGLATTQAGLAADSATAAADSATAAAANALPSGTTNSTIRYNGSSWVETDKLQVDAAGVVTATAGLESTGAGTDSFRAGRLAGATAQGDNGIIINASGAALDDTTAGHIHIASDDASLDYDTIVSEWTATDSLGTFDLRDNTTNVSLIGPIAPSDIATYPEYGDSVWFDSAGLVGPKALTDGETFLNFNEVEVGQSGVLEKWTGTSSANVGTATVVGAATYDSNGFLVTNGAAGYLAYNAGDLDALQSTTDRALNGFTIQYEIENAVFATDSVTDSGAGVDDVVTLLYVVGLTTNVWSIASKAKTASKWFLKHNSDTATGNTSTVETANLDGNAFGSHSLITISVHGLRSSTPNRIDVYRNKSLILQSDIGDASLHSTAAYFIGGASGVNVFPYSPVGSIRNFLFIGNHTIPRRDIKIAVIGDSNIAGSQYQAQSSPYHADNNPPLYGVISGLAVAASPGQDPSGTINNDPEYFYWRDETAFSAMEYYLAEKSLYPSAIGGQKGILSYGLSGAFIDLDEIPLSAAATAASYSPTVGGLKERLDAMYGEGTTDFGPAALAGTDKLLDVVVINLGGNDAFHWGAKPETHIDNIKKSYKVGLDRIIATSKPKAIVMTTFARTNTTTDNTFDAHMVMINNVIKSFEGYRGVCKVADVAASIDRATAHFDLVHYNPVGQHVLAREIVKKINISAENYRVDKGDSAVYNGENWLVSQGRQNPPVQSKVLTGSVGSVGETWTEILKLPMPKGLATSERWAGIGTLESLAPSGIPYAQQFAINAYPNSTEITGSASAPFGTGLSATGGQGVTTPPQLRVSTATGQTYLSVEVKGEPLPAPSSTTPKAFYSWADTTGGGAAQDHSAIVDKAALTSPSDIGSLGVFLGSPVVTLPTASQYDSVKGLVMRDGQTGSPPYSGAGEHGFEALAYPPGFMNGTDSGAPQNLATNGFTLHYEIEKEAFDSSVVGGASLGTPLGLLFYRDTQSTPQNGYLGFGKQSGVTEWAGATGATGINVVTVEEPSVEQTHLNFDISFTKLSLGYRMDVYIERTLWYTKEKDDFANDDLSSAMLHLSGRAGFYHFNTTARIRNVLLINHPVDPYAGVTISAIGVGDSNMTLGSLQGPDGGTAFPSRTAINNPLTTGQVDTVGFAIANGKTPATGGVSGNVFLNSELQAKGISVSDTTAGQQRFFDASAPGWGVLPDTTNAHQTLETIVNDLLGIARPTGIPAARPNPTNLPQWWFCNMGINDVLKRTRSGAFGSPMLNGYPVTDDDGWVTHLCDKYLEQIDRMLASSSDAKVFICSPARMYSAGSNPNDYMDVTKFVESNNTLNSKVNAEFTSRITNHSPGRVFFKDMFTNWTPAYHVSPVPDPILFNGVHFNQEGYRQMALGFASMVPQGGEYNVLRHRLTYEYNDISGI